MEHDISNIGAAVHKSIVEQRRENSSASPEGVDMREAFRTPDGIPIEAAYWLSATAKQLLSGTVRSINSYGVLPEITDKDIYYGGYTPSTKWSLLLNFGTGYDLEYVDAYNEKPVHTPYYIELHHNGNVSNGVAIKSWTGIPVPNQWINHEYKFSDESLYNDIVLKLGQHGIDWVEG